MRTFVFLDLDGTILQTLSKCPPGAEIQPVGYAKDGTALSFLTTQQRTLLSLLAPSATVIPTTARNLDAFRRVALTFDSLAILDFGAVVLLPSGALDMEWDDMVRSQCLALASTLESICESVHAFSRERDLGVSVRVVRDFDMPIYVVVKHPEGDLNALRQVREAMFSRLEGERFFVHDNQNNLSLVPRFLGKERAVRYVVERRLGHEPSLFLGAGDSLTDLPFLELCHFWLVPGGSQLARVLALADPDV